MAFGAWGIAAKRLTSGPAAARRKPRHCPPMPWGARILNMRLRKRDDALMDDGTAELAESVSLSTPGWTPAEPAAQAQMPSDHQAMVRRFGAGCFNGFLWLWVPGCPNEFLDMDREAPAQLEVLKICADKARRSPRTPWSTLLP